MRHKTFKCYIFLTKHNKNFKAMQNAKNKFKSILIDTYFLNITQITYYNKRVLFFDMLFTGLLMTKIKNIVNKNKKKKRL